MLGMGDVDFPGCTGLGASLQGARLTEQKDIPESSRALGAKSQDIAWQRSQHTDWPSLFLNKDPVWSWSLAQGLREPPEPRVGFSLAQMGQRVTMKKCPRIPGVKMSYTESFLGAQDRETVSSPGGRAESWGVRRNYVHI